MQQIIIQPKKNARMSYKVVSNCLNSSILAFFLLFFQHTHAQGGFQELEDAVKTREKTLGKEFMLELWKKDDTLVYSHKAGMVTGKTVAPIADASKWLTAALVMQFVDEGKLSLDDKITKWLPEFEKYGKNYITLRLCLSHQTGIQDDNGGKLFGKKKYASLEEEVDAFARKEIQANPGTEFRYSAVGLNIAGRVLEVVSKKKFDQLIKQKLFNPLTMRNTSFANIDGGSVNPSGGATSSADDYMKFLVMLMNNGTWHGKTILSAASVEVLKEQQVEASMIRYAPKAAEGFTYALGSWIGSLSAVKGADGKAIANVLMGPGLFGTWPMIDFCRGYAYILVTKELTGEEKATDHLALKEIIDSQFAATCP